MSQNKKRILILGGGFAGIECARKLESYFMKDLGVDITLVSEDNFWYQSAWVCSMVDLEKYLSF